MILVESGLKVRHCILPILTFIVFGLFCKAGYELNKEPFPQVYVNGIPYEDVK